jgi:hypothetical protein
MTDSPAQRPVTTPKVAPITGLPIETAKTLWCPFVSLVAVPPVGGVEQISNNRGMRLHYGATDTDVQKNMNCIATRCMSWIPDSVAPTPHGTCRLITGAGVKV